MSLLSLCSADGVFHLYSLVWVRVSFIRFDFACIETKRVCRQLVFCYDFERFRLFAAAILASRLRLSSVKTKECLCCQRYCLKFVELVQVFIIN